MKWKKLMAFGGLLLGGTFTLSGLLGVVVGTEEGLDAIPEAFWTLLGGIALIGGVVLLVGIFGWLLEVVTEKEAKK